MPWESTTVTDRRVQFVLAYQREVIRGRLTMAALCERFGISRKTGYKVVGRHQAEGWKGLADRPRSPQSGTHWIEASIREQILAIKEESPDFGAKKIRVALQWIDPDRGWPSVSTIHAILKRANLVESPSGRRRFSHPGAAPPISATAPNQEWSTDFKGQFRTGDRRYCYPLTLGDSFSRYLLACEPLLKPTLEATWAVFERVFREFGLPEAIRSDNGTPFAGRSIRRLSRLSVRWIRLGIEPRLIAPGKPYQNGRLERLHRTLKDAICRRPAANCNEQRKAAEAFRRRYNERRPHESLGQTRPADHYVPSPRPYPNRWPEIVYPAGVERRRVNTNGVIKWQRRELFLSEALTGEDVGLRLVDDGVWIVSFAFLVLGYFSEHDGGFYPETPA